MSAACRCIILARCRTGRPLHGRGHGMLTEKLA